MYDVSNRGNSEKNLWDVIAPHLERVQEETLQDVMRRARQEHYVHADDVLETLVRTGKLTLDDVRALVVETREWENAQPEEE